MPAIEHQSLETVAQAAEIVEGQRVPKGAVNAEHWNEEAMKTVLITGATGDVGSHLRRELAGKYSLRLSDQRPLRPGPGKAKKFVKADISKMPDALKITKGVDAIVHLGGYSVEGPWEAIQRRTSSAATTCSRPRAATR